MSSVGADAARTVLREVEWPHGRHPVEPQAIAECYGIEVRRDDDMVGTSSSGCCLVDSGGRTVILYNPSESAERVRFTIAHELGHALLHGDGTHNRYNRRLEEYRMEEAEANDFAACLLMPEEDVRGMAGSDDRDLMGMAGAFGVSQTAMRIRLQKLGILRA